MKIDAEPTIAKVIEALLPRNSGQYGLEFTFDLRVEDYTVDDDQSEATVVKFLILRPSQYTSVYSARSNFPTSADYTFAGSHDSGWRSLIGSVLSGAEKDLRAHYASVYGSSGKPTFSASLRSLGRVLAPCEGKTLLLIEHL